MKRLVALGVVAGVSLALCLLSAGMILRTLDRTASTTLRVGGTLWGVTAQTGRLVVSDMPQIQEERAKVARDGKASASAELWYRQRRQPVPDTLRQQVLDDIPRQAAVMALKPREYAVNLAWPTVWLGIVPAAYVALFPILKRRLVDRFRGLNQCASCGYDVRGVATCPECGAEAAAAGTSGGSTS
jgi:hypothetical protein